MDASDVKWNGCWVPRNLYMPALLGLGLYPESMWSNICASEACNLQEFFWFNLSWRPRLRMFFVFKGAKNIGILQKPEKTEYFSWKLGKELWLSDRWEMIGNSVYRKQYWSRVKLDVFHYKLNCDWIMMNFWYLLAIVVFRIYSWALKKDKLLV